MNRSVDIVNELKEISPLVAGIGCGNVFTVPEGYFDTIAGTVLISVGEGYSQATSNNDIPAGYFDNLANNIIGKIKGTVANELQEVSPLLAGIRKENPFKVPAHYFEKFTGEVLEKLDTEEIQLSSTLLDAKKLQPYTIPQGYFDNLGDDVLNKLQTKSGAKLVTMPKRRNSILKYAAAAVFTGAVVLGVYKMVNPGTSIINDNPITALAPAIEQGKALASDDKKFEETLGNLNEDDIAKYLEKNGSEADMALLTSDLDEENLPDQDDYLTDERTLDNFIETINSKN